MALTNVGFSIVDKNGSKVKGGNNSTPSNCEDYDDFVRQLRLLTATYNQKIEVIIAAVTP